MSGGGVGVSGDLPPGMLLQTGPPPLTATQGTVWQGPAVLTPAAPAKPDATAALLTERGSRYGKFEDHARITQALKACMRTHAPPEKVDNLLPDQREALDMIAHKLGRILNGDPDYADSWADIAGYARLVADRLDGVAR